MPESRGVGAALPVGGNKIGLPARPFLYTLDQIATLLDVSELQLSRSYMYFEGRSTGKFRKDLMAARNIAPAEEKPDWRVVDRELVRWMRHKGFKFYDRSAALY